MSDDETTFDDGTPSSDGESAAGETPDDGTFAAKLARARDLLDSDDIEALQVGIIRDGEVDTTFAQRAEDEPEGEGLRAIALLAAHIRLVADVTGVEPSTVAGDAATLAGQVEQVPASTDDLPEE